MICMLWWQNETADAHWHSGACAQVKCGPSEPLLYTTSPFCVSPLTPSNGSWLLVVYFGWYTNCESFTTLNNYLHTCLAAFVTSLFFKSKNHSSCCLSLGGKLSILDGKDTWRVPLNQFSSAEAFWLVWSVSHHEHFLIPTPVNHCVMCFITWLPTILKHASPI